MAWKSVRSNPRLKGFGYNIVGVWFLFWSAFLAYFSAASHFTVGQMAMAHCLSCLQMLWQTRKGHVTSNGSGHICTFTVTDTEQPFRFSGIWKRTVFFEAFANFLRETVISEENVLKCHMVDLFWGEKTWSLRPLTLHDSQAGRFFWLFYVEMQF